MEISKTVESALFRNSKSLKNQVKNKTQYKNCPTMVDNVRVKTLNCARIFKMLHVGAFILHNSAYCIQNSNTQVLSDSQREQVGCGP